MTPLLSHRYALMTTRISAPLTTTIKINGQYSITTRKTIHLRLNQSQQASPIALNYRIDRPGQTSIERRQASGVNRREGKGREGQTEGEGIELKKTKQEGQCTIEVGTVAGDGREG